MTQHELDEIAAANGEATPAMTLGEQMYLTIMRTLLRIEQTGMIPPDQAERERRQAAQKLKKAQQWDESQRRHIRRLGLCGQLRAKINKVGGCPMCEQLVRALDGRETI